MCKKAYYSVCIIPLNCGKRKKICRNFAVQGRMQVDASIDPYNKNCPRQNTAGKFDWLTPAALQQSIGYSFFGAFNPFLVHY